MRGYRGKHIRRERPRRRGFGRIIKGLLFVVVGLIIAVYGYLLITR